MKSGVSIWVRKVVRSEEVGKGEDTQRMKKDHYR